MTNGRHLAIAISMILAAGCGGDDPPPNNNPDAGADSGTTLSACAETIATKTAAVGAVLNTWPVDDVPAMIDDGSGDIGASSFAGHYRDALAGHPGCAPRADYDANAELFISDNEATVPAGAPLALAGFTCAAKDYAQAAEDTSKPIVILVHGNSAGVLSFEEYAVAARAGTLLSNVAGFEFTVDAAAREMLATKLLAAGYKVIGFDAQVSLVPTQTGYSADSDTGNPFANIDHGWAVPMLQSLVRAVMTANPGRKVSLVGHSLGVTVIRDALRRLWIENRDGAAGAVNPFAQLQDVVLLSGANHGVSNGDLLCQTFPALMRGTVGCEMGDRDAFVETEFSRRINGPQDLFATPCADGDFAFGQTGQCGGNAVQYTTVTMVDLPGGQLQDEFISEASSTIEMPGCVDAQLLTLADFDTSGYFLTILPGFFANHFGSARSEAGMTAILATLAD